MNYVNSFDLFGVPAKQIPATPGSGAPTTATEGAVGCLYMDTDTGNLYKCTAVADGVYTWVEAGNGSGGGLSDTAKTLLIAILRNGIYSTDQSANITALETELGSSGESGGGSGDSGESGGDDSGNTDTEVTLSSISATYSGGDVAVGTAVTDLTGIVVTAWYSDGSTATVTDYTLSGEIVEGSNTITVSYGGKTTTFTVTGVAESGGVVAMTAPMNEGSATQYIYSDDGTTALNDPWNGRYYQLSEKTFEEDTEVEIQFTFSGTLSGRKLLACSFDGTHHYYAVELGTVGTNPTGTYTVKAGYRLSVVQNANTTSQGVATVTEV